MNSPTLRDVFEHAFGQPPEMRSDATLETEASEVTAGTVLSVYPAERRWPVNIILDTPALEEDGHPLPDIWTGWIASGFTEYASFWDILYNDHDKGYKMVHTWNIVTVCSSDATVLGQIPPERLQEIRAVFSNFIESLDGSPPSQDIQDDQSSVDTSNSSEVCTGSVIESEGDPRLIFLEIYYDLADELGRKAMESLQGMKGTEYLALAAASPSQGATSEEEPTKQSDSLYFQWDALVETQRQGDVGFVYDELGLHVYLMDADEDADALFLEGDGERKRFRLTTSPTHAGLYLVDGIRKEDIESFVTKYKRERDGLSGGKHDISWERSSERSS